LIEKLFQVLKIENNYAAVAFKREEGRSGIHQISLAAY